MNSKAKNVSRKHRKKKARLACRRAAGLALKGTIRRRRKRRVEPVAIPVVVETPEII